ncbi:MAG TPA: ribosome maturation factor RimM [Burkholderiaceae bacterium]|nr:ribosome maturation factor RimM [Burkholderiaceae bacterium]
MPPGKSAARLVAAAGAAEAPSDDLVELGVLRGAYGVKGWVRIAPHDAEAAVLQATRNWWLRQGDRVVALEVTGVRRHGSGLVAKLAGCDNPEAAERLRGASVNVARADFPAAAKGEYYWVDLLGARVVNRAGVELGNVVGLRNNGAQDLLEIAGAAGAELLVPLVESYVDSIDTANRLIRVDWQQDW